MATKSRRVDIQELGEPACRLIRDFRDSGDEIVLVDGTDAVMVMRPAKSVEPGTEAECSEELRERREAWARIVARRTEVAAGWTSPLSAAEVVEEQRR